jgi:hypothetical protein
MTTTLAHHEVAVLLPFCHNTRGRDLGAGWLPIFESGQIIEVSNGRVWHIHLPTMIASKAVEGCASNAYTLSFKNLGMQTCRLQNTALRFVMVRAACENRNFIRRIHGAKGLAAHLQLLLTATRRRIILGNAKVLPEVRPA